MICPACGYTESKVIDSRPTEENISIRRRRECLKCQKRFTTFEILETTPIMVIKKDKSRELFDKAKLMSGVIKACQKRPVTRQQIVNLANEVEAELQNSFTTEVSSIDVGELVMDKLKLLDEVAYVRFASVYREFKDAETFMKELYKLKSEQQ